MLPPLWVKTVTEIENIVVDLKGKLDSLDKAYATRHTFSFESGEDDKSRG